MTISGDNVTKKAEIEIDPRFNIPPGVVDMRYKETDAPSDSVSSGAPESGIPGGSGEPFPTETPGRVSDLPIPNSITVVEQIIKTAPDGTTLVDVIIEVEDSNAFVTQYDVRVTLI